MRPVDDVKLLTAPDVGALFRVDSKTVNRWANSGRIPYIRTPGGQLRFRKDEIRALLKEDVPRPLRAVDAA